MYNPRQDEQSSLETRKPGRRLALRLAVGAVTLAGLTPDIEPVSALGQAQYDGEERRFEIVYSARPINNFFANPMDTAELHAATPVPKTKVQPTPRISVVTATATRTPTPSRTPTPTHTPNVMGTQIAELRRDYEMTRHNAANAQKRLDEVEPIINDYLENRWLFEYLKDFKGKGWLVTLATRHPYLSTLAVALGVGAATGAVIAGRGAYRNRGAVAEAWRIVRRRPRPVPGGGGHPAAPGGGPPHH